MLTDSSVSLNACALQTCSNCRLAIVSLLHHGCKLPLSLEGVVVHVCTGLLGGAVYVNAFTLISRRVDPLRQEFSLAAASLGDSLGIAFADIAGILIQVHCPKVHGVSLLYLATLQQGKQSRQRKLCICNILDLHLSYDSAVQGCLYKANKIPGASFAC